MIDQFIQILKNVVMSFEEVFEDLIDLSSKTTNHSTNETTGSAQDAASTESLPVIVFD